MSGGWRVLGLFFPRVASDFELSGVEAHASEDSCGHHFIANRAHVNAVVGVVFVLSFGTQLGQSRLHIGVEIGEEAPFFTGQGAEKIIVGNEPLVGLFGLILVDHRGGQDNYFDVGRLGFVDDFGDVFLVFVEWHPVGSVPHIVDSAAEGHPVGFFADDVAVDAGEHVIGFVATFASGNGDGGYLIGFEALDDQGDIALWAGSLFGDGVAEKGNFLAIGDGKLRWGDGACEGGG